MEVPCPLNYKGEDIVYSLWKHKVLRYQQNAIDRIKGVVARPVPNEWLRRGVNKIKDEDTDDIAHEKEINSRIAAETKPWFFIYRYSELKAELDKYIKEVKKNCKIRFCKSLDDLYSSENRTEEENEFIYNYEKYMPVSRAPSVMNRICWNIENEFSTLDVLPNSKFDYSILKSDDKYTSQEFDEIFKLYTEYGKQLLILSKARKKNETNNDNVEFTTYDIKQSFFEQCNSICPNIKSLTNILLDICYNSNKNKSFAWELVGEQIFQNVLKKSDYTISYPVKDSDGDIKFCGNSFSIKSKHIGGDETYDDFE